MSRQKNIKKPLDKMKKTCYTEEEERSVVEFKRYDPLPQYLELVINLKPIAKKNRNKMRAFVKHFGKRIIAIPIMYKDPEVRRYEETIKAAYENSKPVCVKQFDREVDVKVTVYFPNRRGDLDNAVTTILDALQGLVYKNDRQVYRLWSEKKFSKDFPRLEIGVSEYPISRNGD